ncbi:MAG: homoaconitate hydratase family protein, partial [Deltaproteobacteria bacterium]|nr:homoaconitate hydratase family protein [Deltaproteobacteria bacterium]
GFTIIMGDSHTCTHGAFGAFAAGVGTTDLEVGILKGVCTFKIPQTCKIEIIGILPKGVFAKDIILKVIKELGVDGATNMVIEFRGNIVDDMNMDQRMTLANMAVEAGATSGICLPDMTTVEYLWEFIKNDYSDRQEALETFSRFKSDDDAFYVKKKTIDVSKLSALTTFGYKPDNVKPVSEMKGTKIDQVYIGSCTNGRLEDLRIAAKVLEGHTISRHVRGIVSPATPQIFSRAMEEGIIKIFMDSGFCVTNPTCGACLGMSNGVLADGEVAASTTNRNFNGRMGKGGIVHLMSPATAAASAIKGEISNADLFSK